ncbi:hypothetical protein COV58_03105 [Candidatus Roizmanbacteria bacterium CG11_big_fil_rev_8_21_14_0_20_36_8]|uniref:Uncharacterized protein n=2 Tax=Candidatus Roizmaniibacteriota TaxID=1752723 RepID=A0A2M6ITX5_9BACT|nr:MAG: hypothetical protein COV58_03105 [Candidatus Roizmanbacteria bacterium CG11_big_fil_rev_8_21_14_0_20_36_8]PIZ66587.1 MAG: hypothetical protein COY14_00115 [Candidatus Roizmanbacteria bacterium CG_4_10_14_0_2_um_filter_36_9]
MDSIGDTMDQPTAQICSPSSEVQFAKSLSTIALTTVQDQAFGINRYMMTLTSSARGQFDNHMNPFQIYHPINGNDFHGVWINTDLTSGKSDSEITWSDTLENIGDRVMVNLILNILATSFEESGGIYEWTNTTSGFHIERNVSGAMSQSDYLGVPVDYEYCAIPLAKAIKDRNIEEIRKLITIRTSEFIHERAHGEFDQNGGSAPEAVTQGCKFLYNPGNNEIFEKDIFEKSIMRADAILRRTAKTNDFSPHELGNIVWSVEIYEELVRRFSDRFKPLENSAESVISSLIKLPDIFKTLRGDIGEAEWRILQKELMEHLLDYDSINQAKIIQDFSPKASGYGLDFIINPDKNYISSGT